MWRFIRTGIELVSAWFFVGRDERPARIHGMYCVLWCEDYDHGVVGRWDIVAESTYLWESVQFMSWSGAGILQSHGGRGRVFILAPEGFPIREFDPVAPAERARSILERMNVRSSN